MTGTRPNFDDWRKLPVVEAWQLAVLMHGFDPRALTDVAVQNPDNPKDSIGVPLDYSFELRQINGAAIAKRIDAGAPPVDLNNPSTHIVASEKLGEWLIEAGYPELAESLGLTDQVDAAGSASLAPPPNSVPLPKQRQPYQEEVVLQTIRQLGYDPQSLPKAPAGKPGVKRQVRDALAANRAFTGTTILDGAWERLRASGDINDAE